MPTQTKILIGLGNPDEEYRETRHNVGFLMIEYLAKRNDADEFKSEKKFNALISKCKIGKSSAILVKPLCFVNKTGEVAAKIRNFYKVRPENIILAHDDLDIGFGNFKLSFGKNSGGHRGVESVMKSLKTKNFWRFRIGTANASLKKAYLKPEKTKNKLIVDFVLGKFTPKEKDELKKIFKKAYEKLEEIL